MKKFSKSVYSRSKSRGDEFTQHHQPCLRDGGGTGGGGENGFRVRPRSNSFSSLPTFDIKTNNRLDVVLQNTNSKQKPLQSFKRKLTGKLFKMRHKNYQESPSIGEPYQPGSTGKDRISNETSSRNELCDKHSDKFIERQTQLGRLSKSDDALDYCEVKDEVKLPENCYVVKDENCTTDDGKVPPPVPPRAPKMEGVSGNEHVETAQEAPRPPARPKNRSMGRLPGHLERSFASVSLDGSNSNRATVYEIPEDRNSMQSTQVSLGIGAQLMKLPRQPWYWGPLRQHEAEEKLKNLQDGMFLVRDSSDDRYLLSLSFNSNGRTLHTRIEYRNGLFSLNDSEGYPSIITLIENAVHESKHGVFGYMRDYNGVQSFPAKLTDWVSRFKEVRSLQYLCRFVIREKYARHVIPQLPIPSTIKHYVLENQY
ncbi:uncharacterized protein [Antedon mediterranea]|uniref:uncharacterized protein n=1 Tax=Antedon mediterranea TaxID=105859 RepID=UPI003AF9BE08